jgi:hypothetical protein
MCTYCLLDAAVSNSNYAAPNNKQNGSEQFAAQNVDVLCPTSMYYSGGFLDGRRQKKNYKTAGILA